ncbi:hypothetical protein F5Y16DRAFT_378319 [Xylariaceae sp. FL0255]|nr:hypothetical protein F5Y16DRAFT_378319 [Xylariaceae sp. FL0255]
MVSVTAILSNPNPVPEPNQEYPNLDSTVPSGKLPKLLDQETSASSSSSSPKTTTAPGIGLLVAPFSKAAQGTWLRYFHSSKFRTSTFCGRCGRPTCSNVRPMPEQWPEMLHIVLGTVDGEDLEKLNDDESGAREDVGSPSGSFGGDGACLGCVGRSGDLRGRSIMITRRTRRLRS